MNFTFSLVPEQASTMAREVDQLTFFLVAMSAFFTVLIAVFADDTAAYFVGRTIGRHKMAPTISPGKSWEGFVGGTVAAIAVAFFAQPSSKPP